MSVSNSQELLFIASLSWRHHNFRLKHYRLLKELWLQNKCWSKLLSRLEDDYLKALLKNLDQFKRDFEKEMIWCHHNQAHLLHPDDPSYPKNLQIFEDSPALLSCLGSPTSISQRIFCVVGSRECQSHVLDWCEYNLSFFLKKRKPVVLSGGAKGFDQLAHGLSFKNELTTWAVLPAGLDCIYPAHLKKLKDLFYETKGGFISSYSPFQELRKFHFFQRNLILSRMSHMVFLVQAKKKSGSYMTGKITMEEGRVLAALPFFPSEKGLGSLELILNGAHLIRDYEDLIVLWDFLNKEEV